MQGLSLDHLGPSGRHLELCWAVLGSLEAILHHLGAVLGPSGNVFRRLGQSVPVLRRLGLLGILQVGGP